MDFKNKVVLVTGASSGIGKYLSLLLAKEDCKLILLSRRIKELEKLSASIIVSKNLTLYKCDVSDLEQVEFIYNQIKNDFGKIDIAILNAGVGHQVKIQNFDINQAKETFDTNVFGVLNFFKVLLPDFIAGRDGYIIGVSSMADVRGFVNSGIYCASKSALSNILESFRIELKSFNVKVITVRPGFVKTPMTDKNEFQMPFLLQPEKAAQIILNGIKKEKAIIQFPLPMYFASELIRFLPNSLFEFLSSKFPRKQE